MWDVRFLCNLRKVYFVLYYSVCRNVFDVRFTGTLKTAVVSFYSAFLS